MDEEQDSPAEAQAEDGSTVTGSLHTNGGKSAGVPVIEQHHIKDPWFTTSVPKGQG